MKKLVLITIFALLLLATFVSAISLPNESDYPVVGSDNGVWGNKLNKNMNDTINTILVSLDRNGTLRQGLNTTFSQINVTDDLIVLGNIYGEIPNSFKLINFTSAYNARTDRYANANFTAQYDARADRYQLPNFTLNYDSRVDRWQSLNFTSANPAAATVRTDVWKH